MNVPVVRGVESDVRNLHEEWIVDRDVDYLVFIGVDGGGTSTECLLKVVDVDAEALDLDDEKNVAATVRCRTGAANANSVGMDIAYANVTTAIFRAVEKLFESFRQVSFGDIGSGSPNDAKSLFSDGLVTLSADEATTGARKRKQSTHQGNSFRFRLAGVTLGLAGCDSPAPVKLWREKLLVRPNDADIFSETLVVDSDAVIALARATNGTARGGAVIIAGTGTASFAVSHDGKSRARISGYGPAFNDIGSGHWLGSKVLESIARALDGRAADWDNENVADDQSIARAALNQLGITTTTKTAEGDTFDIFDKPCVKARDTRREEIIKWAYQDGSAPAWDRVASLAPIMFAEWNGDRGSGYASIVIDEAAHGLAAALFHAIKRLAQKGPAKTWTVALVGGLFTDQYHDEVHEEVTRLMKKYFRDQLVKITFYEDPAGHGEDAVGGPSAGAVEMSLRSFEEYIKKFPGDFANVLANLEKASAASAPPANKKLATPGVVRYYKTICPP